MLLLLMIIITVAVGSIVGWQLRKRGKDVGSLGKIQTVTVFLLVFFMGTRIGSDERLLDSIQSIGISSVVVTIATMGGSLLAVLVLRKILKLNRQGDKTDE